MPLLQLFLPRLGLLFKVLSQSPLLVYVDSGACGVELVVVNIGCYASMLQSLYRLSVVAVAIH